MISARAQLASTWAQLERHDEALAELRSLQPLLEGVAGDHALDAAMLGARLGYVLLQARQWPEARRMLTHARAEMDRLEGTASANTMSVTRSLAVPHLPDADAGPGG